MMVSESTKESTAVSITHNNAISNAIILQKSPKQHDSQHNITSEPIAAIGFPSIQSSTSISPSSFETRLVFPPSTTSTYGSGGNNVKDVFSEAATPAAIINPLPSLPLQVKSVDMPEEMQIKAIEICQSALASVANSSGVATTDSSPNIVSTIPPMNSGIIGNNIISPRDVAGLIKKEFDRIYGPTWHCIVGKAFGSYVTHEAHCFIFLYLGNWAILLFKTA